MDTGQLNIMSANSFSKSEFDLCKPYRKKKKRCYRTSRLKGNHAKKLKDFNRRKYVLQNSAD